MLRMSTRGRGRCAWPSRLRRRSCWPPRRRSGRSRRRRTSSRATSRTSRSTATAASSSGRRRRQVAETSAPFLWTRDRRRRRHAVGRAPATKGRSSRSRATARCRPSSMRPSSRCMRSRRRRAAASTWRPRPTARSTRSRADGTSKTFFDPDDKYIWALAVAPDGARLRRHRRQGHHLQDHARRQGIALLQDQHDQRRRAGVRQDGQPDRRHRVARPRLPHRQRPARRSCCSTRPFKEIHARQARRRRHDLRGRVQRRAGRRESARRSRLDRRSRPRAPVPSVSTEITAVTVVDSQSGMRSPRAVDRAAARAGREGRDLPHPPRRPVGHDVGSGRRLRRSISLIEPDGSAARRHRQGRQDLPRRRRSRRARRCSPAPRPARSPRSSATPSGRIVGATSNPGQAVRARRRAGRDAAPTTPTSATPARSRRWGVIRWRATANAGRGRACSPASATPRRPTRPGARGRRPTPTASGEQITSPNARYLQWRAVLDGEPAAPGRC